jgi:tRNA 5-methylaminomethyl-2-thiouridine biosynthesis bifunctional protein
MKRDNTPWHPLAAAELQWTESGDPLSSTFGDLYYSRDDGLEESRYVFLQGNDLPSRWQQPGCKRFTIAETGFGTGLNFLLSWQTWQALDEPRPALHYIAVEKHPLAAADMARALFAWPALEPLARELLACYPGLLPGQHRLLLEQGRVTLDLWWEDVAAALPDLAGRASPWVDAWYLDGFAPARNESMWRPEVLRAVAQLSRPGASFATFTAAGQVRRDLADAGFTVTRVPGYGRKRECLRGQLARPPAIPDPALVPWDLDAAALAPPATAIVVGAGLAGCMTAAALARRGIEVTLLDQGKLAAAGSGNEQGILYTRLSRKHSALTDFALQSFRFAVGFYRALFRRDKLVAGLDGDLCGNFQLSQDSLEMAAMATVLATVPEFARVLDPDQARAVLGLPQTDGGYWFPDSGWLRPGSVCRALVSAPNIRLREDCGEISLHWNTGSWEARTGAQTHARAPCAVVATGTGPAPLELLDWLPLQSIRGQTTHLPTTRALGELRAGLCHKGYIAPARRGIHCIGASFHLRDQDPALRARDHVGNLAKLAAAVPAWKDTLEALDPATLAGRVGFRCASPDYLPLAGPVPDKPAFLRDFAFLRKNARRTTATTGPYMPGLYLNTAHGSRGLTSAPLAAELLASQICGEPPPLSRELCRALAPARFLIRDLSRNRI